MVLGWVPEAWEVDISVPSCKRETEAQRGQVAWPGHPAPGCPSHELLLFFFPSQVSCVEVSIFNSLDSVQRCSLSKQEVFLRADLSHPV